MGTHVSWAVMAALVLGSAGTAAAGGVCVAIETSRDNLAEPERAAVRLAVLDAFEREGVAVDRAGAACTAQVSVYSLRLGNPVSTTIVAGDQQITGKASSLDEVDLLVRQLVRSLVTGRSLATGSGVTDRENVLRDQAAPRRNTTGARRWDRVIAIGGGMLQLPAIEGRPRQRQTNIVAIEGRVWGLTARERSAFELSVRMLLHDYAVIGAADDAYDRERDGDGHVSGDELGRFSGLVFSPFAVANWDLGIGVVGFAGQAAPRPFVRAGATTSLLFRLSDPDHRFDVGFGGYVGAGLQLTPTVHLSVEAAFSHPTFHSPYDYFLTTTALLEFRSESSQRPPAAFRQDEPKTIRVIND